MLTSELTSVVRGTANNIFGCVDTYIKIGYDNFLIIYYLLYAYRNFKHDPIYYHSYTVPYQMQCPR